MKVFLVLCVFFAGLPLAQADLEVTIQKLGLTGDDDAYDLLALDCAGALEAEHCEISRKSDQGFSQKKIDPKSAHSLISDFENKIKPLPAKKVKKGDSAVSWSLKDGSFHQTGNVTSMPEKKIVDDLESKLSAYLNPPAQK